VTLDTSYWGTHTRLVLRLQELGYRFKLHDRLPPFKLYLDLYKKGKQFPKLRKQIMQILDDLDLLVALRREGLEPERLSPTRYKPGA
jgi:hypothetical protein